MPFAYRGVLAAALSVSQAYYVTDKLLCECGRIGVVLLVSAQCVLFRKYLLQPVEKFWLRFCHMGNENQYDLFVRQNRRSRSVFST